MSADGWPWFAVTSRRWRQHLTEGAFSLVAYCGNRVTETSSDPLSVPLWTCRTCLYLSRTESQA